MRGEEAAGGGLARGERGAIGPGAERLEAGEEPAVGLQNLADQPDVLGAARRVNRAEAGVLPDAIEESAIIRGEVEDVPLLEDDVELLAFRQRRCLADRLGGEVEAPDLVTGPGQEPAVVAAAAAEHRHPPPPPSF